jgi:hypothetical protein
MYTINETLEYVDLFCVKDKLGTLPPVEEPLYDKDSDSWDLWFKVDDEVVDPEDLDFKTNPEECQINWNNDIPIPIATEAECHSVIAKIEESRIQVEKALTSEEEVA